MATAEQIGNALAGMADILHDNNFGCACADALLADQLCSNHMHGVLHGVLVFPNNLT